jgi:2-polyprenyl-6-methoxyphenol hydroxylase-like FAD-dependent oxidoreductase
VDLIEDDIESVSNEHYSECQVNLKKNNISTKLLVGSDGNKSKVKELSKIPTYGWSYRQKAIACTLSVEGLSEEDNTSAYQIYHDSNILGILPLWKNYISIVWSLQLPDYEHAMQLEDDKFIGSLNSLISQINSTHAGKQSFRPIGRIDQLLNKRLAFPLNSLQAENYTKHRLALIGDAAHSLHPMAGLGVNSGILDSVLLANNIILNKKTGCDIGEALSLSTYEANSKSMNYGNSIAM